MSEFLKFEPLDSSSQKTAIEGVFSKTQGGLLGTIRFYPAWRQYVFYRHAATLFSAGCLEAINERIRFLQENWRHGLKSQKAIHWP